MELVYCLIAAVFIGVGIDALVLGRHASPPTQKQQDDMMWGHERRPLSSRAQAWVRQRYPIATRRSMQIYGWLWIALGLSFAVAAAL